MSNRLTPEREREIREWLPVARRSAVGRVFERETIECAEELLAELDAVRAILEPSAMREFYLTHAINADEIAYLRRVRALPEGARDELYAFGSRLEELVAKYGAHHTWCEKVRFPGAACTCGLGKESAGAGRQP